MRDTTFPLVAVVLAAVSIAINVLWRIDKTARLRPYERTISTVCFCVCVAIMFAMAFHLTLR